MAKNEKNELEKLFEQFKQLSLNQRIDFVDIVATLLNEETPVVRKWKLGFTRNKLVASKEKAGIKLKCPYCRSRKMIRYGVRRGNQWYKCKNCEKTFSSVTNTFLDSTKKRFQVWRTFVKCMMDKRPLRETAEICDIHRNTAFVWRHKILDALAHHQERQQLSGTIEADDTYFPLSFKGSTPIGRKARKRSTPATKRGTSKEKVCVSCAVDHKDHVYSKVSGLGRPSLSDLRRAFGSRFPKKNKSTVFCTDGDTAYAKYAGKNGFKHVKVPSGVKSLGKYNVQKINSYHSNLKGFISQFKGVSTKYLNNYLVWHNVINVKDRPSATNEKRKKSRTELLKLCIKPAKATRWYNVSDRPPKPE